jgi:hypothetical protein
MKRNAAGTTPRALAVTTYWYPIGPGGKRLLLGKSLALTKAIDKTSRFIPVNIVTNENITTVCTTSGHLILPVGRLAGSNNAPIHWKNKATITPIIQPDRTR